MKCPTILASITLLFATTAAACTARPASAPLVAAPSVAAPIQTAREALASAKTHTQAIQTDAPAIKAKAPATAPEVDAVIAHAAAAEAQIAVVQVEGAKVTAGIKTRDDQLLDARKMVEAQTARADKAERERDDIARNRIIWAFSILGVLAIAAGGLAAYLLFQAGSVVRAIGAAVGGVAIGSACFAIAVYFVYFLVIGLCTLIACALGGVVVAILHFHRHRAAVVSV